MMKRADIGIGPERLTGVAAPGKARWPLVAALLYTGFPIYGSLLPFRWQAVPWDTALAQFGSVLQGPLHVAARTDFAANVLLAVPLALLWLGALGPCPPRSSPGRSVAASMMAWMACTALAVALEFSQIFFSGRQPALSDCVAQSLGAAVGVLLWWWMPAAAWTRAHSETAAMRRVVALYLAGVALYGLLPLDLTLSLSELSDKWHGGLVRLVPFATWAARPIEGLLDFVLDAGIWGLAAVLARRAWGPTTADRVVLLVTAAAALEVAQIFVLSRVVDTTDVVAAATGIVIAGFGGRPRTAPADGVRRAAGTAGRLWAPALGAIAALIVTVAPYPVSLTGTTLAERLPALWQPPFSSYVIGTEFELVTSLLRRVFLYGGFGVLVLWALHPRPLRSGVRVLVTTTTVATLAALVEGAQLFQPGRTVDTGDIVLAALVAFAMAWAALALRQKPGPVEAPPPDVLPPLGRLGGDATRLRWVAAILIALVVVAALLVADSAALPYNVRELLAPRGARVTAVALALGLLAFFGGAAVLARGVAPGPRGVTVLRPALVLLGAPLALAMLLTAGMPRESLDDIAGSPILGSMPTLETLGRLTILFLGPFWALAVGASVQGSMLPRGSRGAAVAYLMVHGLWVGPVWHLVVVTWAGTDNLTELMAGGGGALATTCLLLYPVLLGIVGSRMLADAVVFRWSALVRALAVLLLGAAAGYLLLRAGTEPAVMKYGRVFSALQFLLSVDRSAYATGSELALRFLAAHAAACFCAAAGFASAASLTATARSARAARGRAPPRPARASRPDAR